MKQYERGNTSIELRRRRPKVVIAGGGFGGLVLTADLNGDALAFNAADGKLLWKQNTGAPGGGVITYLAAGKQYVAGATGITSKSRQTKAGNAKVAVYALP